MENLAASLGCSTMELGMSLVYVCLKILIFGLYAIVFGKNKFTKLSYHGLMLLNIIVNIVLVSTLVVCNIGWNLGAIFCATALIAIVSMFESYLYYYVAIKYFKRDDV